MNIVNVCGEIDDGVREDFNSSLTSSLSVKCKSNKTTYDDTWLIKMEDTIKYIDNILRNPNRFIVNEEEIVKIELARRITVDSIKHLSRNTNFIQEYNPKTGEVRPSKILNINKEESFNTYENRFIYTLINNMKMYIERKKGEKISLDSEDNCVSMSYQGHSMVNKDDVSITVELSSKDKRESKSSDLIERIDKVLEKVNNLCSSDIYKNLSKLHVSPVVSPIKKTNLILKNVNFQYALDLWNYLQSHMEESTKRVSGNKNYSDRADLKSLMDESFLVNYQIVRSLDDKNDSSSGEVSRSVVNNAINQLLSLKDELTLDDIVKLVGDEYVKVKYKKVLNVSEISRVYKDAIYDYMRKPHVLKVVSDGKK